MCEVKAFKKALESGGIYERKILLEASDV